MLRRTLRLGAFALVSMALLLIAAPPVAGVPEFTRLNSPESDLSIEERDSTLGEDFVAWTSRAEFNTQRIQLRHLSSGRQESISDLPGKQIGPKAVGREVFWIQEDEGVDKAYYVMRKVLATEVETRMEDMAADPDLPLAASEWGWVAWVAQGGDRIAVDNINGDDLITVPVSEGAKIVDLDLGQDRLVWVEQSKQGWELLGRRLSDDSEFGLTSTSPIQSVTTNGRNVAWVDTAKGSQVLRMTEQVAGEELSTKIVDSVSEDSSTLSSLALSSDSLFWVHAEEDKATIRSMGLDTPEELTVHADTEPISELTVRRNLVSWTELQRAEPDNPTQDYDVVGLELLEGQESSDTLHPSTPTILSTETPSVTHHASPATDGRWAVWSDNRRNRFGVFARELVGGEESTVDSGSAGGPIDPTVHWPLVAWVDASKDKGDLMIKDMDSDEVLQVPVQSRADRPQMSGSFLLWSEVSEDTSRVMFIGRNGPDLDDLSKPQGVTSDIGQDQRGHHLYKDVAVWTESGISPDAGRSRIMVSDLATGDLLEVATASTTDGNALATPIGVFWQEAGAADHRVTIRYRAWAGSGFELEPAKTVLATDNSVMIGASNDSLVYLTESDGVFSLKAIDTNTKLETVLQESERPIVDPVIAGDYIVWQDQREGNSNIYASSLSGVEIPRTEITSGGTKLEPIRFIDPLAPKNNGPGCSLF